MIQLSSKILARFIAIVICMGGISIPSFVDVYQKGNGLTYLEAGVSIVIVLCGLALIGILTEIYREMTEKDKIIIIFPTVEQRIVQLTKKSLETNDIAKAGLINMQIARLREVADEDLLFDAQVLLEPEGKNGEIKILNKDIV